MVDTSLLLTSCHCTHLMSRARDTALLSRSWLVTGASLWPGLGRAQCSRWKARSDTRSSSTRRQRPSRDQRLASSGPVSMLYTVWRSLYYPWASSRPVSMLDTVTMLILVTVVCVGSEES